MYKALRPRCPESFPWDMVWKSCVQPNIWFFAWEAIWGKILTNDQLQKRGFSLANGCYLCFEETGASSVSLCKDEGVMGVAFSIFGVVWVNPETVADTLLSWRGVSIGKRGRRCGVRDLFACFGQFGRLGIGLSSIMSFFLTKGEDLSGFPSLDRS